MSTQIVANDPIDLAKVALEKLPDHLTFEIPNYYFRGLDFATGIGRAKMMREFESLCRKQGYETRHSFIAAARAFQYDLKRKPQALDGAIEI